ncbi:MAG: hypothetical protein ACRDGM_04330 [bacterium]
MKVRAIKAFWGGGREYALGSVFDIEDAAAWLREGVVEVVTEPLDGAVAIATVTELPDVLLPSAPLESPDEVSPRAGRAKDRVR